MNKKHVILLLSCTAAVTIVLGCLLALSPLRNELRPSSFTRLFADDLKINYKKHKHIGEHFMYISGATKSQIWLSDYRKPFNVTELDSTLQTGKEITIQLIEIDSLTEPGSFRTTIDSPFFFLSNGIMPLILKGNINEKENLKWRAQKFIPYKNYHFAEATPITDSTIALLAYSAPEESFELAKLSSSKKPHFQFKPDLLSKQQDGIFSVHGTIHYSKLLNKIIYIYFYRNEFIVTNAEFTKVLTGHTIDTFKIAPIRVSNIKKSEKHILSSPPNVINDKSCVWGKHLYVKSNLLAKNEQVETFLTASTIDVYDIETGKYIYSFHIPNYKLKKLSDFRVVDNIIYVLFEEDIVQFKNDNIYNYR